MVYDLSNEYQLQAFNARAEHLKAKGKVVELLEKNLRTGHQNSYLHLLIGVVAMETGNTIEDTKVHYFKEEVNKDIFATTKVDNMGKVIHRLRSTTDLSKEEMSMAIDRFKRWGAENGFYMPSPGDEELLKEIAVEMERNKAYLGN